MLFFSGLVKGQVEGPCAESLSEANREFEAGHFFEIPGILKQCLEKNDFSREQRIQAYYLLTRTYLFLDKADSAEISFLKLLKNDPEYKVTEENDPIEMVYLSEKFVTTPIFSVKVGGGANYSFVTTVDTKYGADNSENSHEEYFGRPAYHLNGAVEVHFSDAISVETNVIANAVRYHYQNEFFNEDPENVKYNSYFISTPVFLKYTFETKKIWPYVFAGYQANFLFHSRGNYVFINRQWQPSTSEYADLGGPENVKLTSLRYLVNHSAIMGFGAYYKINYKAVFAEARFVGGLGQVVKVRHPFKSDGPNSRSYEIPQGVETGYAEDEYRLNSIYINIGYIWPLYKPRKKDEMTLRDIFKK